LIQIKKQNQKQTSSFSQKAVFIKNNTQFLIDFDTNQERA
jgi:hypothetical protein